MDSRMLALELLAIRRRIDRCLESETGSRQTALEDVHRMILRLERNVAGGLR